MTLFFDTEGVETRTCTVCGETETRPQVMKYMVTNKEEVWTRNSPDRVRFTVQCADDDGKMYNRLSQFTIDGESVLPEYYCTENRGLDIIISNRFLAELSAGEHIIKLEYSGDYAFAKLTIVGASGDMNGDGTINVSDISLLADHVKGIKSLDDVNGI